VTPAHLPARSLFDAMVQLEWIHREDTAHRAFAYQYFYVKERMRFYRSIDPATREGRELVASKQADGWVNKMTMRQVSDLADRMESLERG
jgi:hypothetical protein